MLKKVDALSARSLNPAIKAFEKRWLEWLNPSKDEGQSKKDPPPTRKVLNDGGCLRLIIVMNADKTAANARWEFYKKKGKTLAKDCTVGLGPYPRVSLAEARAKRNEIVAMLNAGVDPKAEKARRREEAAQAALEERRKASTFREVAKHYIAENEASWALTNSRRAVKERGYLENHVGPVFGDKPVGEVNFRDALQLVQAIADKGLSRDLVTKCRQFTKDVLAYAMSEGLRDESAPFPFDMAGPYGVKAKPILEAMPRGENMPALKPEEAHAFFAELTARPPSVSRNALIFAMLTTLRVSAVAGAQWAAVNWEEPYLEVSDGEGIGTRKTKKQGSYLSYLSSYAVALLKTISPVTDSPYIFVGEKGGGDSHITREAIRNVIKRMNKDRKALGLEEWRDDDRPLGKDGKYPEVVPHGVCRATFRTWVGEDDHDNNVRFPWAAAELVLDHCQDRVKGGRVAKVYDRSKLKKSRLQIVEAWGRFLVTGRYPDEPDGEPCEGWRRILRGDDAEE